MEIHFGNPRKGTQDNVFDTGLGGSRHGNGVPVTTQACGYPEDVYFRNGRRFSVRATSSSHDENGFPSVRNKEPVRRFDAIILGPKLDLGKADRLVDPGAIAQKWWDSDKKNWCREGGSNPHEVALGGF
jgi:hypothetical protein